MDQRVEKLEGGVNLLNVGQQQILDNVEELFERLGSRQPFNEHEMGENFKSSHQYQGMLSQPCPLPHTLEGNRVRRHYGLQQSIAPKLVKLDFPCFNGEEDRTSWTCRVEQFFQFHQTPEEEQVALASFHLKGDAQLWFQQFKQEVGEITWQEFCDGATQFQDFFGKLTKLQ
ncbi:hypothetical protein AMTRI_Chr01g108020 [Amborella trichopoda]